MAGYPRPPGLVNSYQDVAGDGVVFNVSDLATTAALGGYGHSGLISTSADLGAFIAALAAQQLLAPEMLTAMMESTECDCYGLGLAIRETSAGRAVGHSGADTGTRAEVWYVPDAATTIVWLDNAGSDGRPEQLYQRFADEVFAVVLASD